MGAGSFRVKKAALYIRVSSPNETPEAQRKVLNAYAAKHGITVADEFIDGVKDLHRTRTGLDALMAAVDEGEIDGILVRSLDRIGINIIHMVALLSDMDAKGIPIVAVAQGVNTSKESATGIGAMALANALAEFEGAMRADRIKIGLIPARAMGQPLGRPSAKLVKDWRKIVAKWKKDPTTYAKLAQMLGGVSTATAWKLAQKEETEHD